MPYTNKLTSWAVCRIINESESFLWSVHDSLLWLCAEWRDGRVGRSDRCSGSEMPAVWLTFSILATTYTEYVASRFTSITTAMRDH